MQQISSHIILVHGHDLKASLESVAHYFETTTLVRYDHIDIAEELVIQATQQSFFSKIDEAIAINHTIVKKLLTDLQNTGLSRIEDLPSLQQGYPSKVLHILTHFLDGFIGIDSHFYNLVDDSHWLSSESREIISKSPEEYWLYTVKGFSVSPDEAALLHM